MQTKYYFICLVVLFSSCKKRPDKSISHHATGLQQNRTVVLTFKERQIASAKAFFYTFKSDKYIEKEKFTFTYHSEKLRLSKDSITSYFYRALNKSECSKLNHLFKTISNPERVKANFNHSADMNYRGALILTDVTGQTDTIFVSKYLLYNYKDVLFENDTISSFLIPMLPADIY